MTQLSRNATIDILRGIAIVTMVAANLSASLLQDDAKTLIFRLYGTFAAPLFILLAGMMVALTQLKHPQFNYYLQRGLLVIAVGCVLDMAIWQNYPLLSYDVLYLTGFAIPCVHLLVRYCPPLTRLAIAVAGLLMTPFWQYAIGYRSELASVPLASLSLADYAALLFSADTTQRFWLDGWFPVLPWLSVAIIGSVLGSRLAEGKVIANRALLITASALLIIGVAVWVWQQPTLFIRDGYSELFYPPTIGYFFTAIAVCLLLFYGVEHTQHHALYYPFITLGQASLFMYIVHQIILAALLNPIAALNHQPLAAFLATYLAVMCVLILLGIGLTRRKQRVKNLPFLLRFLLGG
jgi:uncharacterized membrane protein